LGEYATGLFFLDKCEVKRSETIKRFESAAAELDMTVICWRDVPCDNNVLGASALRSEPQILQAFIVTNDKSLTEKQFQRKVYVLRKWMTHTLDFEVTGNRFYICSLSTRTLVYKGQFEPCQLWKFYGDLVNPDYITSMCLVHTRSETYKLGSSEKDKYCFSFKEMSKILQ
jgi:glutamate synthase (NADPH/NADH)